MDGTQKHYYAKRKKSVTKDHIQCDSIYMNWQTDTDRKLAAA